MSCILNLQSDLTTCVNLNLGWSYTGYHATSATGPWGAGGGSGYTVGEQIPGSNPSIDIEGWDTGYYAFTFDFSALGEPDVPEPKTVIVYIANDVSAGTPEDAEYCLGDTTVIDLHDLLTDEDMGGVWQVSSGSEGLPVGALDGSLLDLSLIEEAGTYCFGYTVSNAISTPAGFQTWEPCSACISTTQVCITLIPAADPGEPNTLEICLGCGEVILFDVILGTPGPDGVWTQISGPVLTPPATYNGGITFTEVGTYVFRYTVGTGNCETTVDITIEVIADPSAGTAVTLEATDCLGQSYNLIDSLTDPDPGGTWECVTCPSSGSIDVENGVYTPVIGDNLESPFVVKYVVDLGIEGCTCSDEEELTINVSPCVCDNVAGASCDLAGDTLTGVADDTGINSPIDTDTWEYSIDDGTTWLPGNVVMGCDLKPTLTAEISCQSGTQFGPVLTGAQLCDGTPALEIIVHRGDGSSETFLNASSVPAQLKTATWWQTNHFIDFEIRHTLSSGFTLVKYISFFGADTCGNTDIFETVDPFGYRNVKFRRTVTFSDGCEEASAEITCDNSAENPTCPACTGIDIDCNATPPAGCTGQYIDRIGSCAGSTRDYLYYFNMLVNPGVLGPYTAGICETSGGDYYVRRIIGFGNGCPPVIVDRQCTGVPPEEPCVCSPNDPGLIVNCNEGAGTASATRSGQVCYVSSDILEFKLDAGTYTGYSEGTVVNVPSGSTVFFRRTVNHSNECYPQDVIEDSCTVTQPPCTLSCIITKTTTTLTATPTTNGNGSISYQWYGSTDGVNFTVISGAISSTYNPPCPDSFFPYYSVIITLTGSTDCACGSCVTSCETTWTCPQSCFSIFPHCNGCGMQVNWGNPPSGCTIAWQWQFSADGINWSNVSGQTSTTISLGGRPVGWYRLRGTCPTCVAYSAPKHRNDCCADACSCNSGDPAEIVASGNILTFNHNVTGTGGVLDVHWNKSIGNDCNSGWGENLSQGSIQHTADQCNKCYRAIALYTCGEIVCQQVSTYQYNCGGSCEVTCLAITQSGTILTANTTGCAGTLSYQWYYSASDSPYSWSARGTAQTQDAAADGNGHYRVVVTCDITTETCICESTKAVSDVIDCNFDLTLDLSASPDITAVPANCTGVVTYIWFYSVDGGVYSLITGANSATHTATSAGFYKVIAHCPDGNGCDKQLVHNYASPAPCSINCEVNQSGSLLTGSVIGCSGNLTYQWEYSASDSPFSWSNLGTAITEAVGANGWYRFNAHCPDGEGCDCNTVFRVIDDCVINCNISKSGSTLTASGTGCAGAKTYQWHYSASNSPYSWSLISTNSSISLGSSGYYRVTIHCPDGPGCDATCEYAYFPCEVNCSIDSSASPTLVAQASGCSGSVTYDWYYSTNGSTFIFEASGATIVANKTGYWQVIVNCTCASGQDVCSAVTQVTICDFNSYIDAGSWPTLQSVVTGCVGTITREWRYSTDNITYGSVLSTAANYTATQGDGYYKVKVTCSEGAGCNNENVFHKVTAPCNLSCGTAITNTNGILFLSSTGCLGTKSYEWYYSSTNNPYNWVMIGSSASQAVSNGGYYRVRITCPDGATCFCERIYNYANPCNNVIDLSYAYNADTCVLTLTKNKSGVNSPILSESLQYSTNGGATWTNTTGTITNIKGAVSMRFTVNYSDGCMASQVTKSGTFSPNCGSVTPGINENTCGIGSATLINYNPTNIDFNSSLTYNKIFIDDGSGYVLHTQGQFTQGSAAFIYRMKHELGFVHTNCCVNPPVETYELCGQPQIFQISKDGPIQDAGGCYFQITFKACHFTSSDITSYSHPISSITQISVDNVDKTRVYRIKVYPNPGQTTGSASFTFNVNTICGQTSLPNQSLDCGCPLPTITIGNISNASGNIIVPFTTTNITSKSQIHILANNFGCYCNVCSSPRSCSWAGGSGSVTFPNASNGSNSVTITVDNNCGAKFASKSYTCAKPVFGTLTLVNNYPNIGVTLTGVNLNGGSVLAQNGTTSFTLSGTTTLTGSTPFKVGSNTITITATNGCGTTQTSKNITCPSPAVASVITAQCNGVLSPGDAEPHSITVRVSTTNMSAAAGDTAKISINNCSNQTMTHDGANPGQWFFTGNCGNYGSNSYTITLTNKCSQIQYNGGFTSGCSCTGENCLITQTGSPAPGSCYGYSYTINVCTSTIWTIKESGTQILSGIGPATGTRASVPSAKTVTIHLDGNPTAACTQAIGCNDCTAPSFTLGTPTCQTTKIIVPIQNLTGTGVVIGSPTELLALGGTFTPQTVAIVGSNIEITPNCATMSSAGIISVYIKYENDCGMMEKNASFCWPCVGLNIQGGGGCAAT